MNWRSFADDPALRGFAAVEVKGWRILVRRAAAGWAAAVVGGESEVLGRVGGGRAEHPVVAGPEGGRVVVRRYRRGGLMRHVNGGRYFIGHRAFEELRVTERAREAGVRVPEVLMAAERRRGVGYTALFATRLIEGAVGADRWLTDGSDGSLTALRAAGEQIRRMHDGGIAHPDLNLKNLLVSSAPLPNSQPAQENPRAPAGPPAQAPPDQAKVPAASGPEDTLAVHLIDFDRARLSSRPVASERRARDLRRLARSARKLGVPLDEARWDALREGYGPGWPLSSRLP